MNMKELVNLQKEIDTRETFEDILSVHDLRQLTGLSETAIYNAIVRDKLVCKKFDAEEGERGGFWLISLKSAMQLWPKRFSAREFQNGSNTAR